LLYLNKKNNFEKILVLIELLKKLIFLKGILKDFERSFT